MQTRKTNENPYIECELCKDLGDCKHVEVAEDMMGSPQPPDNCPRGMEILKKLYNKRKHDRTSN